MGANGGVTLVTIKGFKNKWAQIKQNLIDYLDSFYLPYEEERDYVWTKCSKLPDDISDFDDNWIDDEILKIFRSYDSPTIFKGLIICAWGDNVDNITRYFNNVLYIIDNDELTHIETWS